jgi:hypothetical protein
MFRDYLLWRKEHHPHSTSLPWLGSDHPALAMWRWRPLPAPFHFSDFVGEVRKEEAPGVFLFQFKMPVPSFGTKDGSICCLHVHYGVPARGNIGSWLGTG